MTAPHSVPLQQSRQYAAALRLMGCEVTVLERPDAPPVVALNRRVGPLRFCYLPRADLRRSRHWALSDLSPTATRLIIPDRAYHVPGGCWPVLTPQHVAEVTRPPAPMRDHLLDAMHGKWRNRLRRALDGPLTTSQTPFDPERHAALLSLELAQRRRRGYRSYPLRFLAAWARANPASAPLFVAQHTGVPVAFMLFLRHGDVATYTAGWTGPEGRRHHAHNLLMWRAMLDLFDRGVTRIDLGTVDTEGGAGLTRFKLGSGARARTLGPTLLAPAGFRVSP